MSRHTLIWLLATLSLAAGCAQQPLRGGAAPAVQVVALAPAAPDARAIKALVNAQAAVDSTQRLSPGWLRGRELLQRADAALAAGDGERVWLLAREAEQQARQHAAEQYRLRGQRLLSSARSFARLSDAQADRLRAAELAWARADHAAAHGLLRPLVFEFFTAMDSYRVRPGDTLATIAARPEVYENGELWPLLWRDNKGLVRSPQRLVSGWQLRVRRHPRLEEIFDAVVYARARAGITDPRALDQDWLRPRQSLPGRRPGFTGGTSAD